MSKSQSLWSRYLNWRKRPPQLARRISATVQTISVFLWCSVTYGTGLMAHLDYDLDRQVTMHMQNSIVLLGTAAASALVAPTRSWVRCVLQALAIGLCATLAALATVAFN